MFQLTISDNKPCRSRFYLHATSSHHQAVSRGSDRIGGLHLPYSWSVTTLCHWKSTHHTALILYSIDITLNTSSSSWPMQTAVTWARFSEAFAFVCFFHMISEQVFRCHWRTRAMQCLTPTVLYPDVDGQCDKLVTDNGHKFTTLTVHLSWQHLRRSAIPEIWLVPTKI